MRRQAGITCAARLAPIRLLTSEIVVVAKELTITKKSIEILLTTFAAASSHSPKCSIATKKRNHGAIQKKDRTIVHMDIFRRWRESLKSNTGRNPYCFESVYFHIYNARNNKPINPASEEPIAAPLIPNRGESCFPKNQ